MTFIWLIVLLSVFFCIGIMAGMLIAFNAIIEVVNGLVDFLVERREYLAPDSAEETE